MKFVLATILVAMPTVLVASHSVVLWDLGWDMDARPGGYWSGGEMHGADCWLTRGYSDESELTYPDAKPGDFTIFDSFQLRFVINADDGTESRGKFEAGKLFLFLYSTKQPKLSEQQLRIVGGTINGMRWLPHPYQTHEFYELFHLDSDDSEKIFESLRGDDPPALVLELSNGASVMLKVPVGPGYYFEEWRRMLYACANLEVD